MAVIRRNSFIVLLFSFVLLLSFVTILSHNSEKMDVSYIHIEQGDTLWSLAESYSGNIPHQEWIETIMETNDLDTYRIAAGQSIAIPSEQLDFAPDETVHLAGDSE